jgi:hypothetical protein
MLTTGHRGVVHAELADGPEQRLGQAAVAPAAHHEQVGAFGPVHQHRRSPAFHHVRADLNPGSTRHISVIASVRTIRASSA